MADSTTPTTPTATRRISATRDNAAEMRAAIRRWPQLEAAIRQLQAQNLFPGLRALQITLQGSETWCAKGLGAIDFKNAPAGAKPAPAGQEG